jgi:predicted nucleic acid-binding protein
MSRAQNHSMQTKGERNIERTAHLFAIRPELLFECGRLFCLSSYSLCSEYRIYAIDALYLSAAISSKAILVSLDREDFIDKLKKNRHNVEAYYVSDFPY